MPINAICRDVKLFLAGLAGDLPEIFPAPRPVFRYRRAAPARRSPSAAETAARRDARAVIGARVRHWASIMGLTYKRVAIKDQRTLWGSCSGRGNLNFNWRLAAAAPEVLDYVVIHELCHLREMNHSRNFWALVQAHCPEYAARRRWLRDNCAALRNHTAGGVN
jgi:predicted metal-dependent hydrolase